jgi:uncharacterized membrane protein YedE/YeeE
MAATENGVGGLSAAAPLSRRVPLIVAVIAAWVAITWLAGLRQGVLFVIGVALGGALAGAHFGFTTGWRMWIKSRDPTGLLAQFLAIGLAMAVSIPLAAAFPNELVGAVGPLSVSLVLGAFVFGAAMQVADGCGSGTLYKAGLGNAINIAVVPGFIAGTFLGAAHLDWWLRLGSLGPLTVQQFAGTGGAVVLQLAAFGVLSGLAWRYRRQLGTRWQGRGVFVAAVILAVFAVANLVVAGQPWGIVYGVGLWGAKIATALGWDPTGNAYWGREAQLAQIAAPVLDDATSVTNFGLLAGSLLVAAWRNEACPPAAPTRRQWVATLVTGFVLGYSARLAFGCNIGAYFAGIASGSLHGWVWFACAFAGSRVGVRLRERLGFAG